MNRRRVVVTGMGAITPLALNVEETWQGLLDGRSGIGPITQFDASELDSRIAGEVKGFDPKDYISFKEARRMSRVSQLAVAAAQEAVVDAGLEPPLGVDAGVVFGAGVGGLEWAFGEARKLWEKGPRRVSPFGIPASLINMPAHHVSGWAQALGHIEAVVAACATGTQAIGEATEAIRHGRAEVIIAGGAEGFIHEVSVAGFCIMRGLSTRNDEPERASRPFDADRDGLVLAEGSGAVVLESLEHARARGAAIHAEVMGYAAASDGFHVTQPDPEGGGAARAIAWALEDAGMTPEDIDYINAHGTATLLNDPRETRAIKRAFGQRAYEVPISSTKSMLGHSMGAAGAIEAVVCVLSIRDQIVHPTANLENPDPKCDLDFVPDNARQVDVKTVLSDSLGLGGQNACLVISEFKE